jgi:DUF1009 family protein
MKDTIGIIAGNGKLPLMVADGIRRAGHRVIAVGHIGITSKDIQDSVDGLWWVHIGELGKIIEILKQEQTTGALLAGAVAKTNFFSRTHFFPRVKPDERAIQVLSRLGNRKDDVLLRAIADEVESEGIRVLSPVPFLQESMAPRGCWTERKPNEREIKDISFGWEVSKEIASLDVGQTIVLKDQMVLAIEGLEGTDATIRRGAKLGRGDVMVIKVCKPKQDLRLDLPVIGLSTIRTLVKSHASSLVVEAEKTIVVDKPSVIREANRYHLCLLGM